MATASCNESLLFSWLFKFSLAYQYNTNKIDIKFKFQVQIGIELDSLSFLNSLAYVKVPSA